MHSRLQYIKIGDEVAKMLVTPSLFSIARRKGIKANIEAGATAIEIHDAFLRIMYCAYLNYAEVERMDSPDYPEPNLKLMDFVVWAAENPKEASEMVEVIFELVTGKSLKKTEGEEEKKKENQEPQDVDLIGDWEPIRDFLIGYCGRGEIEACKTSFIEYRALIKAHNDREYAAWDRVRTLAHNAYMLTATKGTKIKDRKKFMPLAWDDMNKREIKAIPQPASEAEINELNRIANLFMKKKL